MELSIIIVNWNSGQLLKQCIQSIVWQTRTRSYEIIVIDNNSSDESLSDIDYPQVRIIKNNANRGFSKATNQGIIASKGEFVLLLNPDMVIHDEAIDKLLNFIKSEPLVGMVGAKLLNPDGTVQHACRRNLPNPTNALVRLFGLQKFFKNKAERFSYRIHYPVDSKVTSVGALSGACMLTRREAINQVGLLDENIFMYGEDLDWCYRFQKKGYQIVYFPHAEITHYHGASSRKRLIRSTLNLYQSMAVYYKKHFSDKNPLLFNCLVLLGIKLRLSVSMCAIMLGLQKKVG